MVVLGLRNKGEEPNSDRHALLTGIQGLVALYVANPIISRDGIESVEIKLALVVCNLALEPNVERCPGGLDEPRLALLLGDPHRPVAPFASALIPRAGREHAFADGRALLYEFVAQLLQNLAHHVADHLFDSILGNLLPKLLKEDRPERFDCGAL